jgi:twitching motility protein PilJ
MALVDQLKNLFKKKVSDEAQDSRLSLSAPDVSLMSTDDDLKSVPAEASTAAGSGHLPEPVPVTQGSDQVSLPFLGYRTVVQHQRILSIGLGVSVLVFGFVTWLGLSQSAQVTQQIEATGQALMQSQRLAKSVSPAVQGDTKAFVELAESAQVLTKSVRGMLHGDSTLNLSPLAEDFLSELDVASKLVDRAEKSVATLLGQQKKVIELGAALRLISQQSSELSDNAEAVLTLKMQQNAPASEVAAAGQLALLGQRIGNASHVFFGPTGIKTESVARFGKDLISFNDIVAGLSEGNAGLRLNSATDDSTHELLSKIRSLFEQTQVQAGLFLASQQSLLLAREAQLLIVSDSTALRNSLQSLQTALSEQSGLGVGLLLSLLVSALLTVLCVMGLSFVQLQHSRLQQHHSEAQEQQALRHEQEAKRVNDANQAAILRLMNELQSVAEGDLTQVATVTEDITGAIADSVNYTVEELRSLVGNVQSTVARVAQTTSDVDMTSTELLAASNEQLHEIREAGRSVVDMASRINLVSAQAQASADVARQSLKAAEVGLQAVQDSIGGMNTIRDQIQETAKRIKRLGESSQEIGEITELISDITEQTNVLALNAAIQAASAGEAGRGFSVVAEEVQRLAERSADATRQIAALVKAIQTDTQDAIGAMERSTQGVVEGAKLSDHAGTALSEIDQVSRRLAELIEQISATTLHEANLANNVAGDIQHIFAVTEQTGEGTRSTAAQVRELSKMAEELRQSVARFRIA